MLLLLAEVLNGDFKIIKKIQGIQPKQLDELKALVNMEKSQYFIVHQSVHFHIIYLMERLFSLYHESLIYHLSPVPTALKSMRAKHVYYPINKF